jgi:release factor glutamine methyltransferase
MSPNIGEILEFSSRLESVSDSPALDVQTILCHVLGRPPGYLFSHPELILPDCQAKRFFGLLARRQAGEPVAYLTGTKGFWDIELSVGPGVLIPRPETELLVELALSLDQDQVRSMVDLGTGSGAIAISIAGKRPQWTISATDISTDAISIARKNARDNHVNINFIEGHWFQPLSNRRFDLIVSNPPYIDPDDPHLAQPGLRFEPEEALVSDLNGLSAINEIVANARHHLTPEGWIILEHGYDQSAKVCAMLESHGYQAISVHKDLAGNDRAAIARFNKMTMKQN